MPAVMPPPILDKFVPVTVAVITNPVPLQLTLDAVA